MFREGSERFLKKGNFFSEKQEEEISTQKTTFAHKIIKKFSTQSKFLFTETKNRPKNAAQHQKINHSNVKNCQSYKNKIKKSSNHP